MQPFLLRVGRKLRRMMEPSARTLFRLSPPSDLTAGISKTRLFRFLQSVRPAESDALEMATYCDVSFGRLLHTFELSKDLTGSALELGANPYFMTMLLRTFTPLDVTLANYFGTHISSAIHTQQVLCNDFQTQESTSIELTYSHFNVEQERFPFEDNSFDVVLFCEILEHLVRDPFAVLIEIKRVLRPTGALILTTPNVHRLENIARLLSGHNIYDPYSGYGLYGRHNREYTSKELRSLLEHAGFSVQTYFSADSHENQAKFYFPLTKIASILPRETEIGEYHFVRARSGRATQSGKPSWLYRSF